MKALLLSLLFCVSALILSGCSGGCGSMCGGSQIGYADHTASSCCSETAW